MKFAAFAAPAGKTPSATSPATLTTRERKPQLSDDFDSLFDDPAAAKPAAAAPVASAQADSNAASVNTAVATVDETPAVVEAPALWLALYKPGADVQYEGVQHTVSHVHISRNGLFVRLKEKDGVVPAEKVNVALTRVVLPLHAYQAPRNLLPPPLSPGPARTK